MCSRPLPDDGIVCDRRIDHIVKTDTRLPTAAGIIGKIIIGDHDAGTVLKTYPGVEFLYRSVFDGHIYDIFAINPIAALTARGA